VPERHAHDGTAAGTIVQLQQRAMILDDVLTMASPRPVPRARVVT